jgi:hypothetical protein
MPKPAISIGIRMDPKVLDVISKTEDDDGLEAMRFFGDSGNGRLYLVYAVHDSSATDRLSKSLPENVTLKTADEKTESFDVFTDYFRACIRVARVELRLRDGVPLSEHSALADERQAAVSERDELAARLDTAVRSDAKRRAEGERAEAHEAGTH